jgi:hypothetical protein
MGAVEEEIQGERSAQCFRRFDLRKNSPLSFSRELKGLVACLDILEKRKFPTPTGSQTTISRRGMKRTKELMQKERLIPLVITTITNKIHQHPTVRQSWDLRQSAPRLSTS